MINTNNTIQLGPYTVRVCVRPDNAAFPCYAVYRGEKLIGKQFSYPSEEDCRVLEREKEPLANPRQRSRPDQCLRGNKERNRTYKFAALASEPEEIS